jgi:hypothetical protein
VTKAETHAKAGPERRDPVVDAYLVHVDRSLIRKNLGLSVAERFRQLMELQRFAAELRRAGERASGV